MDEEALETLARLPEALLSWYPAHCRPLPWREDREPYHIWLSEVMLQQTRVEAVKGYYARFLAALPDAAALAACPEEQLAKLWEGLGYYSRMRNLKKAAVLLVEQYGGAFPRSYPEVRALPGVGDYTAGAICSIAYDLPTPAVDGNVMRLVSRLLESDLPADSPAAREQVRQALARIYPPQAGQFTQALMELGATLCGPNRPPDCPACPCREFCAGRLHGTARRYPVRTPKKPRRTEDRTVLMLRCGSQYALTRRPDTGLLASMWQFPDLEGKLELPAVLAAVEEMGLQTVEILRRVERKHIFTHIIWQMRGYYLEVAAPGGDFAWLTGEQIDAQAALPTAYRQFWEEEKNHV